MAAKTPRSKTKPADKFARPAKGRSLLLRGLRRLWRPLPLLCVAVGSSVVMFWPLILASLPDLTHREEFEVTWSEITVTPPERWVPAEFVSQVQQRSGLGPSLSLLDSSLVGQLAHAFAQHPWVAQVQSVEKQSGGVRVQLRYRSPALMVQTKRGMYPVDAEGTLLPPVDFSAADTTLFPRLEGVQTTPQGPAGLPWGDPAVSGASRLAAELSRSREGESAWDRYNLESIVLLSPAADAESGEAASFGLRTASGSRIVWGHAPGADALEPTIEQKLERLEAFQADNGRLDELTDPVLIDVHDWELIRWDVLSRTPAESGVPR